LSALAASRAAFAQSADEHHRRADEAIETFLLRYWDQSRSYLRHVHSGGGTTGYWTFAQGCDALLDAVERTDGTRYAGLIETFFEAQAARGWIVSHYDDEAWMGVALLRAFYLTGESRYLETAELLFEDIRLAWDETCCGDNPGGLWWDKAKTQKATAANAGAAILAARLSERNGEDCGEDDDRPMA